MDKSEKRTKLDSWRQKQRDQALAAFPLSLVDLKRLFEHVDTALAGTGCDHTLRAVLQWLDNESCDTDAVIEWLRENGGYCDCEVIGNVEDHVRQNTGAT